MMRRVKLREKALAHDRPWMDARLRGSAARARGCSGSEVCQITCMPERLRYSYDREADPTRRARPGGGSGVTGGTGEGAGRAGRVPPPPEVARGGVNPSYAPTPTSAART